jgi:hypothetical protein
MNNKRKKKRGNFLYERKHVDFGFLSLANFTLDGVLLFHPFTCK